MASKYISKTLVYSPYHIGLCVTEKEFLQEIKKLKIVLPKDHLWLRTGASARTHEFYNESGDLLCLVCIRKPNKFTTAELAGILAHEATHIWQFIKEELGERNPSVEFEAYSIGNITQGLLERYKNAK